MPKKKSKRRTKIVKKSNLSIWVAVVLVAIFSILDIFINVISLIPFIGDILETIGEAILEGLTIVVTIWLGMRASKKR